MAKSELLKFLKERGFFHQCTDEGKLDALLATEKFPIYIGFDCTAKSLHVGSLLQIMVLRQLQKSGFKPIILLGGGTTKVGDPSGKDESRLLLDEEAIAANMAAFKKIFEQFITFGNGKSDAILVNNDDWLSGLKYIEFLRDVGRHFSVNRMLSFDSVKLRLEREQNLSFLEFNYMILQAYDFYKLYKDYGCRLQIGGSDQWGNIVNGVELQRRMIFNEQDQVASEIFGITTPLVTTSSGAKMGKTAKGAVWLTEDMLSSFDYWQFWRNTEDQDVGKFLRMFTDLPIAEIEKLEKLEGADINQAKIVLANEATKICHGQQAAIEAEETAKKTFEQGGIGESLPVFEVAKSELEAGIPAYKALHICGLAASGGEAKRLINGGGAKINDIKFDNYDQAVTLKSLNKDGVIKLSAGKKKHAILKVA